MIGAEAGPVMTVAAAAPIVLLFIAILTGRLSTPQAASLVLAVAGVVGWTVFGARIEVLSVAAIKGVWLGIWILGVVWPALLLYGIAQAVGLERIGALFATLLSRRRETLLLLAWVFPAFVQGVAGFGTPIAVCAPLLVAAGWSPVRAVLYPLIGYHWSVTFGSMGSSFYMAALTAQLGAADQNQFALLASTLLALQCLAAGALVLWLDGGVEGLREGSRMLFLVGGSMAVTLVVVAVTVPAVASLAAGTAGFAATFVLSRYQRSAGEVPVPALVASSGRSAAPPSAPTHPSQGRASDSLGPLAPYLFLLVTALPVFLVPSTREWVRSHVVLAPDFPGTMTRLGWVNEPVADFTPFPVFGHPGFYIVLAAALGYVAYKRLGLWPDGPQAVVSNWMRSLPRSSYSIIVLAALATVLTDTGMVSELSSSIAQIAGPAYPAVAPFVGAVGSFMTGSTTTSNALFSTLQADVAGRIGTSPGVLLAAQTAGGNIGNSLAPVVALIGVTTVGDEKLLPMITRRSLAPAGVLLAIASVVTVVR